MLGRHKLLILITALLLIPLLLGMTPLKMAHRLASGGPLPHCKHTQWSNYCPFHTLAPHGDPTIINSNLTSMNQETTPAFDIHVLNPDSTHSNVIFNSVHLRC